MFHTHRDARFASCGVVHALHDDAVEFFNHGKPGGELVNGEFARVIKDGGIASTLLLCRFSSLAEIPCDTAPAENGDDTTGQPTELATSKYGSAENQHHGVNYCVNPSVEFFGYALKPVAVPDSKSQIMLRVTLSWLVAHSYLILVIPALAFLRGWGGFSGYVKFIRIGHSLLLVG